MLLLGGLDLAPGGPLGGFGQPRDEYLVGCPPVHLTALVRPFVIVLLQVCLEVLLHFL